MRRALSIFTFLALLFTLLPSAPVQAQDPCDGLVAPRLTIGGAARVTSTYGVSLKNQPLTGAAGASEVQLLTFGTTGTVLDGSRCNLGYRWWQLQLADGTTGWAAEGGTEYFMEPVQMGLDVFQRRDANRQIAHFFVTPGGTAELRSIFTVQVANGTPATVWQQVETDRLAALLAETTANCPDRLAGTDFEGVVAADALNLPLPTLDYDIYPAPDGERLVLVRHQHLLVPRCDTVVPERVGMSSVSVLGTDGSEQLLFPFPQNGSVPDSVDRYTGSQPAEWNVYLDEVVWSPHGKYIAFVAAYRYTCNRENCYRFHIYVQNLESGQLYVLGEGRHVGWSSGGETINFFRLTTDSEDTTTPHLYTARPDGSNRQEIWLPGGAEYVSETQTPFDLPWDTSGTSVMVANMGWGEVMLFNTLDRAFTTPVTLPDLMPSTNRLSVEIVRGGTSYLWATIRGRFVLQNASSGRWSELESEVASTGIAPQRVRAFSTGNAALVEMADNSAYVLNLDADTLTPVQFP